MKEWWVDLKRDLVFFKQGVFAWFRKVDLAHARKGYITEHDLAPLGPKTAKFTMFLENRFGHLHKCYVLYDRMTGEPVAFSDKRPFKETERHAAAIRWTLDVELLRSKVWGEYYDR